MPVPRAERQSQAKELVEVSGNECVLGQFGRTWHSVLFEPDRAISWQPFSLLS
jgi:hypothetical protein